MLNYLVVLYDGECNLCNNTVKFIIKRDKKKKIKFAALQSEYAQRIFREKQIKQDYIESIILLYNNKLYYKSYAALTIFKYLAGLWPVMYIFIIIPKFIRDYIYDYIAKNRIKWFGKTETCLVMTPELKKRFIA